METGGFVPWDKAVFPRLSHDTIIRRTEMPTEEELEQITTAMIERQEEITKAIHESVEKDSFMIDGKTVSRKDGGGN